MLAGVGLVGVGEWVRGFAGIVVLALLYNYGLHFWLDANARYLGIPERAAVVAAGGGGTFRAGGQPVYFGLVEIGSTVGLVAGCCPTRGEGFGIEKSETYMRGIG